MQPIFTHPQSGLQVYAVDQGGNAFPYTFFDIGKNQPDIGVILHPTNSGPVILRLVNTGQQQVAVYAVAMTLGGYWQFNVWNYQSETARPPFPRLLHKEPDVILIEPDSAYALSGMTGKSPHSSSYPFILCRMGFDGLWAFEGHRRLKFFSVHLRFYPGDNNPTRYPYDLEVGFRGSKE